MNFLLDKKFRIPRLWSNLELNKFSHKIHGSVLNVSGWKDSDKNGAVYKEYFSRASSYVVSNVLSQGKGFQGVDNEIVIDLEKNLDKKNYKKFDVVFNHTTLEHVFNLDKAFKNLCALSKNLVIVVVPFIQEQHFDTDFGDYWRFTPHSIHKLFEKNHFELRYINFNDQKKSSIYIFAVASSKNNKGYWINKIKDNKLQFIKNIKIGKKIIDNNIYFKIKNFFFK
jgi:hypothetical protein